ncbi:hypothetical protein DPEC_G00227510 [Dallia pectoralis]|uniref:Uncharacterized protein n=1 Tax=Dallia pectoralis TaxID=75939 RepID=A0ACC2G136_DALPE|nr:hypothetical protein DPEC_G00227510 [Dallia pectoralis]
MAYRAAPLANGYSFTELLMGRKIRTPVPVISSKLNPGCADMDNLKRTEQKYREKLRQNHDQKHRARDMPCLQPGDHVWVKDTGERGTVVSTAGTPRSYIIETPGSTLQRNRYHLSPTPVAPGEPANLFEPAPESTVPRNTAQLHGFWEAEMEGMDGILEGEGVGFLGCSVLWWSEAR